MVDFNKLLNRSSSVQSSDPIEIYSHLDRRGSASGDLRNAQKNILSEWYTNHTSDKEVIIKLHTGEGKTLVGMLILLSRMYSEKGPSLYVCPNKQLASQASQDATKFGIPHVLLTDETELPFEFLESKKILITHVQKVFNGKTIFGLDNRAESIGSFVLDDSHACIDSIRNSCSITIKRESPIYTSLLNLFEGELKKQGPGKLSEIESNTFSNSFLAVPYWDWVDKVETVLGLLLKGASEENSIKFALPILEDHLRYCTLYFSSRYLQIAPYFSTIERFSSFYKAGQKILMSATTQDDSSFIRGLGISKEAILNPLTDRDSKWSGEKMIIFPSIVDERITSIYFRSVVSPALSSIGPSNVAILVPNSNVAYEYGEYGCTVVEPSTIDEIIKDLKFNINDSPIVLNNRYDGIDLPDDMCRILVLDSMPNSGSLCDRYEVSCREGSDIINIKLAQKIEQGLGRSVRSLKDYSIVLIIGNDLVNFMKNTKTRRFFSAQTNKQITIGEVVAEQLKEEHDEQRPFKPVKELMNQCLKRDNAWKDYYTSEMDALSINDNGHPMIDIFEKERKADLEVLKNNLNKTCTIFNEIRQSIDCTSLDYGWYMQEEAKYKWFYDKSDSQCLQKKAYEHNSYLLMPDQITYKKLEIRDDNRIQRVLSCLRSFNCYSDFKLHFQEVLSNLTFGVDSEKFENALFEIGKMLGFESDRPDKRIKKGPDVIWGVGRNSYIVIECKNEVKEDRSCINKEEVGQMENSCGWFEKQYGKDTDVIYYMVHPRNAVSSNANFSHRIQIVNKDKLDSLKKNIDDFIRELSQYDISTLTEGTINKMLNVNKLDVDSIKKRYSVDIVKNNVSL